MVLIFYCFIIRDPILPNRSVVAPIPIVAPGKMDYDVEKSEAVILPPPAIQPEPGELVSEFFFNLQQFGIFIK